MKKKTKRLRRVRCCGNCKNSICGWTTYSCLEFERDVEYDWVCDYHKREAKEVK